MEPNNESEQRMAVDEQSLFLTARRISDSSERKRFVQQACGADSVRFDRIMSLLKVDFEESEFLRQPVATSDLTALFLKDGPGQGDTVGHYRLVEPLGIGGMGIVWLAEQSVPIRRRVALKIMNTGFGTESDLKQFDCERQLLAILDHPGIVKLLDAANAPDGRPWFAMEFVTGQKITDYCRQNKLSLLERLTLFLDLCDSVEHAHKRGVVHKDLKPANILVSKVQGRTISKLIDFGVAAPQHSGEGSPESRHFPGASSSSRSADSAIAAPLNNGCEMNPTPSSLPEAVVQGTLAYMSPEQASCTDEEIDYRTDIYSLGALLYELVAGESPYAGQEWVDSDTAGRLRMIRETTPVTLSARLSRENLQEILANRCESGFFRKRLTSLQDSEMLADVDQIVTKACQRERSLRYQSVREFADDLERCRTFRPLLRLPAAAAIPRKADSLLKWSLRNLRTLVLGVGLVGGGLMAAILGAVLFSGAGDDRSKALRSRDENTSAHSDSANSDFKGNSLDPAREALEVDSKVYVGRIREGHFLAIQGQIDELKATLQTLKETAKRDENEDGSIQPLTFEERYLATLSEAPSRRYLIHSGKVFDVRFTPDGSRIVSCGGTEAEYRTKIQDAQTGEVLTSFANGANSCWVCQADGVLMTAEDLGWVSAWDLSRQESRELFRIEGFHSPVGKVWVSKNGELLLATEVTWQTLQCRTTAWNLPSKKLIRTLEGHRVLGVDEPVSQMITSASSGNIEIRTLSEFEPIRSFDAKMTEVTSGDVSRDGRIAAGNKAGRIWLWNGWGSGQQLHAEGTPVAPVRDVVFSTDNALLFSAHNDGTLRIWDVLSGKLLKTLQSGSSEAWSLDVSPDGSSLAAGLSDGTVCVYDLTALELGFHRRIERPYTLHRAGFSPDGTAVAIPGVKAHQAEIIRVGDGHPIRIVTAAMEARDDAILDCILTDSPNEVVLTSRRGQVYVANSEAAEARVRIDSILGNEIGRPTISADGKWIAIFYNFPVEGERAPLGIIWDLNRGKRAFDLPRLPEEMDHHPHRISAFSLGQTGRMLSIQGQTAAVWPADSLKRASLGEPENIVRLPRWLDAADLDGQGTILISTEDEAIFVWDSTDKSSRPRLLSRRLPLLSAAVSPDGRTLATGGRNGELLLWNLPSGEPLFSLPGASGAIYHLQFTRDGQNLHAIIETPQRTGEILHWGPG